jgi:hypothetical protein
LASKPQDIAITAEQISEVDKRLEEYRKNPNLGAIWEEVKARILGPALLMELIVLLAAESDIQTAYNRFEISRKGSD